jgi:hypothetical protein
VDQTLGIIFLAFLVVVPVLSVVFGAESRPAFLRVDRRPELPVVGSMRPEDWPPTEFKP